MEKPDDSCDFEVLCRRFLTEIEAEPVPPRIAELARELADRLDRLRAVETDKAG